ncbi:MAG: JAB domain-containing protein [Actinomycetota bacterium]
MTERYRLTLVREPAGAPFGTQIWAPADLATVARSLICDEPQEIVLCMHLDRRHRLRGYHEIARGGIASAQVDMQILFGAVLLTAAPAFALAHNHPSGEATPSPDDIALTRRVARAADLLGVEFVDHLVVTPTGFASLRDHGAL